MRPLLSQLKLETPEDDDFVIVEDHQIPRQNYDSVHTPGQKIKPLFLACSGGNGHIAAIKALIANLHNLEFPNYPRVPYHEKQKTVTGLSIFVASKINCLAYFRKITKLLNLPVLPKKAELDVVIRELDTNPELKKYIDVLLDIYPIGYESAAIWNIYQRTDQTNELLKLIRLQSHNDKLFRHDVYEYYLNLFIKAHTSGEPYTEVFSTQVMGLSALCDAVSEYNRRYEQNIVIHQYMTDLPTEGAVHFFQPLSKLTPTQQAQMKVYAVSLEQPVLDHFFPEGHTFKGVYHIDVDKNPMLRAGFLDKNNDNSQKFDQEIALTLKNGTTQSIHPHERIASIMLGSQASNDTVRYIEHLLASGMERVFVFGGTNQNIKKEIDKLLILRPELVNKIVLLDNQDDSFITSLMTRSDILVIRSGGLSVMEQMAMPHPAHQLVMLHHADSKDGKLQSGISWEDKNADKLISTLTTKGIRAVKTCPSQVASHIQKSLNNEPTDTHVIEPDAFDNTFEESIAEIDNLIKELDVNDLGSDDEEEFSIAGYK